MQIVIDIPENAYYNFMILGKKINNVEERQIIQAFEDGTPLPKGHGRLGDLDTLEKEIVNGIRAGNYEEGYETFAHINDMDDCVECVKYASTIIEADKEVQE